MTSTVADLGQAPAVEPEATWVDEAMERYLNPHAFVRRNDPGPTPSLQEEILLKSPDGRDVKLEVHMLKERPLWSKVYLFWTFKLADVEGDANSQRVLVGLVFDSWTGSVQISENAVVKVDEVQKPIIGGEWATKTDFGQLTIKIVPYWTGYQYELWHEGREVYTFFA